MLQFTMLSALILVPFAYVSATAVPRDISPAPANATGTSVSVDIPAQTSAYVAGLQLSDTPADSGNVTADTIRLVNFNGCSNMAGVSNAEAQIYSGWQQAQKIMGVEAIKNGEVDFNTAGALEYLGAAGLNAPRQGDMNVIFKNFATLTPAYWPFGWRLHVRCDDPDGICLCNSGLGNPFAYTTNKDAQSGLARINFCPRYFSTPSLNSVISSGQTLPAAQKYNMDRYWNTQGHVFTHETMHIDWVTGASSGSARYGNNEHVTDMLIQFRDSNDNKLRTRKAYEPMNAKILARWPTNTGDYVIRNADNLALFMTSQYVQSQLGNAYPQYPLIRETPTRNPWLTPYDSPFVFADDGTVTVNTSNPLAAVFFDDEADATQCALDQDEPSPSPMIFSSFAPDSAYPSDYISSVSAFAASETFAPDSIMTAAVEPSSQATGATSASASVTLSTNSGQSPTVSTTTSSTASAASPSVTCIVDCHSVSDRGGEVCNCNCSNGQSGSGANKQDAGKSCTI